uniref:Histidine kinase n=1 Tax=Roseihalotalea indica TaxID=2867963 RepID=A0AA49GME0_9BACT|nr:histidine kinase [Tunicatimonas sp. TK19036]
MSRLARIFQVKHFLLYNALFWCILGGVSLVQSYTYAIEAGISFDIQAIIRHPISTYLSFWILSFIVFDLFLATRTLKRFWFWGVHMGVSLLFGVTHKTLSYVNGLLLERLFLPQETKTWRELIVLWQQTWPDIIYGAMLYFLILFVLFALDYWHRFRDEQVISLELQNRLVESQLSNMKMQMQPHFLFNALNTIAMMVRKNSTTEAITMISSLSEMLRNSLSRKRQQFITLEDELRLIDQYLNIEKVRYQDRLTVEQNIQPEVLSLRVPNLILQPIVENAFKHGISQSMQQARLSILAQVENGKLVMEVFNTGNQLPDGWHLTRHQGIGLGNTISRLMQLYRGNFKFQINEKEDGVAVRMVLPID